MATRRPLPDPDDRPALHCIMKRIRNRFEGTGDDDDEPTPEETVEGAAEDFISDRWG